ncbi:MAG TPA: 4Fe-4S dicluster domain-containing protein [Tetrasphaera sp.]|jgi:formate dehydrogenase iron-sulfur subunit|uniref:4Fe-4S dicluster domain-containing protein n=1 Tax=Nostocoides sp. TaxID=1917966 RepID=UPI002CF16EA1|nr:4Fe-4S dicluster domain-containing protein [Tetrasphaera sp.]HNQ07643.1 4Fe-4S dicluster domain-containing protein [Tetrasphaera sp.]
MGFWHEQLAGPTDPARDAGWGTDRQPRKGFFTDTSICIGCKACEVACKEWNTLPMDGDLSILGMSYDNTGDLGATTWRHVAFVEQTADRIADARRSGAALVDLGMPSARPPDEAAVAEVPDFRWLMASDVCKHCTHAGCLDVCPTGALFRSEFGTVVVQADVCNGCGYCVPACPFGVIERREPLPDKRSAERVGVAQKCTLCYDRLDADLTPACAKACPTTSIQFGDHDEMRRRAHERVEVLHAQGLTEARVYGGNEHDGVGGTGSVFLLLDEPEVYGLPPDPIVATARLPEMFRAAGFAATGLLAAAAFAFLGRRR